MLHLSAIVGKDSLTHDEAISYLAATVNQGAFDQSEREGAYPAGRWVHASEWKQFLQPRQFLAFRQIGIDLATIDVHPPLYFWLLHVWTVFWGMHVWTGPTLNLIIFILGMVCLYGLGQTVLKETWQTAVVVAIWGFSPAVIDVTLKARQYGLFATLTIIFVWHIALATDVKRQFSRMNGFTLALVTAAGALTHFHFILPVAGVGLLFICPLLKVDKRRFWYVTAAIGAGYGLFLILHPQFYLSFQELVGRQMLEAQFLSKMIDILRRLYAVVTTFTGFWVRGGIFQASLFIIVVASFAWTGIVYCKDSVRFWQRMERLRGPGERVVLLFVWLFIVSTALYVIFLSPIHAMTSRHMSALWPFFAFTPVVLLRLIDSERRRLAAVLLGTAVFLFGASSVWTLHADGEKDTLSLNGVEKIVADGLYPGILPRVLALLPDDSMVYVAHSSELQRTSHWMDSLGQNAVYISDLSYDNTEANRDLILAMLSQKYQVAADLDGQWPIGSLYFLQER